MYDSKWSGNGYDRFGYVQRGYDNNQMYEQAVDMYREWERAIKSKAKPKQTEPKPDRRILLVLG